MRKTIGLSEFTSEFMDIRPDNFSYSALEVLFYHFESIDPDTELDVIGICCEYAEDTPEGIAESYDIDLSECEDDIDIMETVKDWLEENTTVCGTTSDDTIVYCSSF